jgi:hypothetical protein
LPPSPYSTHNLNEYVSHRVESRLEGFHDPLSNYGNCGMAPSLADTLHLAGTSRYNAAIQQKMLGKRLSTEDRKNVPAHFANVPQFYNHSELIIINSNAMELGIGVVPFPNATPLIPDNGERFFFGYHVEQKKRDAMVKPHPNNDRCQCDSCSNNPIQLLHEQISPTKMLGLEDDCVSAAKAVSPKKKRKTKETVVSEDKLVPMSMTSAVCFPTNTTMPQLPQFPFHNLPCYPYGAPSSFQAGFMNPMVPQGFPMMPMMAMAAGTQQPRKLQAEYCCLPYQRYVNSDKPRIGRPPHDPVNCFKLNNFRY